MKKNILLIMTSFLTLCCMPQSSKNQNINSTGLIKKSGYSVDRFADIEVLRYEAPGFESLSLQKKQLLYHLSEAALMGRDILFDQNNRYNLAIRNALEAIYQAHQGDRNNQHFQALETYLKRVWFASGIHHHYSAEKFEPGFSETFFKKCIHELPPSLLPLREGQSTDYWLAEDRKSVV